GTVRELNSRSVVIETADGRTVHLPNHELLDSPIVNYTTAGRRRTELEVRIAADVHRTSEIINLVMDAVTSAPGVRSHPGPSATVTAMEPERTMLTVQIWHDPAKTYAVAAAAVQSIAERMHTAGLAGVVLTTPARPPMPPPPPL